jgi:hypothetical protein
LFYNCLVVCKLPHKPAAVCRADTGERMGNEYCSPSTLDSALPGGSPKYLQLWVFKKKKK